MSEPHAMTERESNLFVGVMDGMSLFEAATDEQAKEIKKDYFGTDDDLVLIEVFQKALSIMNPDERDVIWNTMIAKLGLQDLDMDMEQALDMVRSKIIHDKIPILHWSLQPQPIVVHDPRGDYVITEAEPEPIPALPADPTCVRPIPCHSFPAQ